MGDEETQLLADGCVALLQSVFAESNWYRWNGVKQQAQMENNTQGFIAWLLDLAEQDMNRCDDLNTDEQQDEENAGSAVDPPVCHIDDQQQPVWSGEDPAYYAVKLENNSVASCSYNSEGELVMTDDHASYNVSQQASTSKDVSYPVGEFTTSDSEAAAGDPVQLVFLPDKNAFHCLQCKVALSGVEVVREHLYIRHPDPSGPAGQTSCPMTLACYCCQQKFSSVDNYVAYHKQYAALKDPSKSAVCDYCATGFASKQALEDHIINKHLKSGPQHECPQCHKKFGYRQSLARHKRAGCTNTMAK